MRNKSKVASALLYALASCGAPAYANYLTPLNHNEDTISGGVQRVSCSRKIRHPDHVFRVQMDTYGTKTKIGGAVVTAAHVVENCGGELEAEYSNAEQDLAILEYGNPGHCKNAELGEVIIMAGYPATYRNGRDKSHKNLPLEMEYGIVIQENMSVPMTNNNGVEPVEVYSEPMSAAATVNARPGYSGGGVYSALDGRLVGIISAQSGKGAVLWFIPIEDVCDKLDRR